MDKFIIAPKKKISIKLAPIGIKGFCIGEKLMKRIKRKLKFAPYIEKEKDKILVITLSKENVGEIIAAFLEEYEDKLSKSKRLNKTKLCKKSTS